MKRNSALQPQTLFTIATVIIMLIVLLTVWQKALQRPDIRGTWSSIACEPTPGGNDRSIGLKRTYDLSGGEWKTRVDYFIEPECKTPTFSVEMKGPYELGDKSKEIQDATHGEFNITSIKLTPRLAEVAQVFEQSHCGNTQWEVDEASQVGDTGWIGFTPKSSDCPILFNTVKRDGDSLYWSDNVQGQGLCKRGEWPKELNPAALSKVK